MNVSHRWGAMALMFALAACSSKKDDPQATTGMTWTVDGSTATDVKPQVVNVSTNIDLIGASNTASTHYTVHVAMPAQVGSYSINSANAVAADYIEHGSASSLAYLASTGTVTISALTATRVAGSFSFTAYNYSNGPSNPLVKTVTNGQFDVPR